MHKSLKTKILVSLSLIFLSPITLLADINEQVLSCGQIESNTTRLACFDNISKVLSSEIKVSSNDNRDSVVVDKFESEEKIIYVETPKPEVVKDIEKSKDSKTASFGLPVERTSDDLQIRARLIGDIKRWDENSVFKLDNGQIWRAVRSNAKRRRSPVVLSNPEVTITRAVLGSYDLRIKGMQGKLKVKRIK